MKFLASFYLVLALFFSTTHSEISASALLPKHPGSAWENLKDGNKKFVRNHKFAEQRKKLRSRQNPRCVTLCCSDSRVPPEHVFLKGLGKLFVARVAGQVVDDVVIDSIEYAVGHFDANTLVVLGHSRCGAVKGALKHLKQNGGQIDPYGPGHLHAVLIPIETAIVAAGIDIYGKHALKKSIRANIEYEVNQLLLNSTGISQAVIDGKINIIGAEYNLKSGKVRKILKITKHNIPQMFKVN